MNCAHHRLVYSLLAMTGSVLALLATAPAVAQPVDIVSGAQPAQGLVQVGLTELWRTGGENDEVFFGSVGAVRTDAQGRIYVLDSQLSEVQIYSPEGQHLGTAGREGDGPGETRRPGDMFISGDGVIHLLQGFPGRIVKLTGDGQPAGESKYSTGPGATGQFVVLIVGRAAGDGMVLGGTRMTMSGAVSQQTYFLARCDAQGVQQQSLLEKQHEIDYAAFKLDEQAMDFVWSRLAVGPDGRVYAGPERDAYKINVYGPDGSLEKVLSRPYTAPARDENQRKIARQIIEAVGAYYPRPPQEITIANTEPVLTNLTVTEDGRIWAQTPTGNRDVPQGTWLVWDVFDPAGRFEKQVALQGGHDPNRDAVFLLPGNRAVVVVGALDAWLNQQGAAAGQQEAEEGDPLEIICYAMNW